MKLVSTFPILVSLLVSTQTGHSSAAAAVGAVVKETNQIEYQPDVTSQIPMVQLKGREVYMSPHRAALISSLFSQYDKKNYPTNMTVTVGLSLKTFDINQQHNELVSTAWLKLEWIDPRLKWEPRDFGGETQISYPRDEVFIPDLVLYNPSDPQEILSSKSNVVIKSNGHVGWYPPSTLKSNCDFSAMERQPFGPHKCDIIFGSWTHSELSMDLKIHDSLVDVSSMAPNRIWAVVDGQSKRSSVKYDCCPEPFVDVTFILTFQRRNDTLMSSNL